MRPMALWKDSENWLLKNARTVILGVVGFFSVIVTALRNVEFLNLKIAAVVRKSLVVDSEGRSVLNLLLFAYLCLLPIVLVILVLLLTRTHLILRRDRKSTRLNSSHGYISYAVFCLKKKKQSDL